MKNAMSGKTCTHCHVDIKLWPKDADGVTPQRWLHVPALDARCMLYAEPQILTRFNDV